MKWKQNAKGNLVLLWMDGLIATRNRNSNHLNWIGWKRTFIAVVYAWYDFKAIWFKWRIDLVLINIGLIALLVSSDCTQLRPHPDWTGTFVTGITRMSNVDLTFFRNLNGKSIIAFNCFFLLYSQRSLHSLITPKNVIFSIEITKTTSFWPTKETVGWIS